MKITKEPPQILQNGSLGEEKQAKTDGKHTAHLYIWATFLSLPFATKLPNLRISVCFSGHTWRVPCWNHQNWCWFGHMTSHSNDKKCAYVTESANCDVLQSSWEKCYMTSWQCLSFILWHNVFFSRLLDLNISEISHVKKKSIQPEKAEMVCLFRLKCYTTERMYSKPNQFVIE